MLFDIIFPMQLFDIQAPWIITLRFRYFTFGYYCEKNWMYTETFHKSKSLEYMNTSTCTRKRIEYTQTCHFVNCMRKWNNSLCWQPSRTKTILLAHGRVYLHLNIQQIEYRNTSSCDRTEMHWTFDRRIQNKKPKAIAMSTSVLHTYWVLVFKHCVKVMDILQFDRGRI